ncbi:MAG TPA: FAD-dependent oxidoreductase [Actinomycetes bacterium]
MTYATSDRRRVAVIGSGVSGLTAAWALQPSADVTLYEADDRLGGHAHTHDIARPTGGSVAVDTGFIVHNRETYPTLLRLFAEVGVTTQDSDMSMSVRCEGCGLEYAGARGLGGLFAQPSSVVRPRYLRMLTEVPRFHRAARALLTDETAPEQTLGEFLAAGGYSQYFVSHFMTPVVSAVWSCAPELALDYPARYLFAFLLHHGMLSVTGSPQWRTVTGGSRTYVDKVAKDLTAVSTSTPVRELRRFADRVEVRDDSDCVQTYDAAVVATHPDQALALLAEPTRAEREVLGAFRYSRNETVLHTDESVLPRSGRAQASWNYRMRSCRDRADRVLVSYDMTRLQQLPGRERFVVTLGGARDVDPASVLARMVYHHPVYTPESVAAQARLGELDTARVAFAGAYHGWGFHEDGCLSGFRAAQKLGGGW